MGGFEHRKWLSKNTVQRRHWLSYQKKMGKKARKRSNKQLQYYWCRFHNPLWQFFRRKAAGKKMFYWSSFYKGSHYVWMDITPQTHVPLYFYSWWTDGNNNALQRHCTENAKQIFPEMKLRGLVPNSLHSHFCEQFIYSHDRYAYSAAWKQVNLSREHISR